MLILDRTQQGQSSRGPGINLELTSGRSTTSSGGEGIGAFVSTAELVELPQFVHRLSSPIRYAREIAYLRHLASLVPGWDGHDAARVAQASIDRAIEFLNELHARYQGLVVPPMVGPLPDGGAVLVWRTEKKEVEINFTDAGGTIDSAVTDRNGEHPEEFHERIGIDSLLSVFVPDHLIG